MRPTTTFVGENILSQYVCPSCSRRVIGQNNANGSAIRYYSRDTSTQLRSLSSSSSNRLRKPHLSNARSFAPTTTRFVHSAVQQGKAQDDSNTLDSPSNAYMDNQWQMNDAAKEKQRQDYVRTILEDGQSGKIMAAFLDPSYRSIMSRLPAATFVEALHLLSPGYFIEPYKEIQKSFHNTTASNSRVEPLAQIFSRFTDNLWRVVDARRQTGHVLGLAEYTHLLDCARSMGDAGMANRLWEEMATDGVSPDVQCYNYYMEAKVWDMAYVPKENHSLRSTPWIYRKRRFRHSNPGYKGFKTGKYGALEEVHTSFEEMVASGLNADESTFIQLMTASSREWDIPAINRTLKAVWNIDTEHLQNSEEDHPPVARYPTSSPLHPTEKLLFAVAHIFGSNNDVPTALRLVDFISVNYNIPIPKRTWTELFVWSYILSIKRYGRNPEENMAGHIPKDSVMSVFSTMTSEPYNIQPTLHMYDILTKLNWSRQSLDAELKYMRDGRKLFFTTLSKRTTLSRQLVQAWESEESERQQSTTSYDNPAAPIGSQNTNNLNTQESSSNSPQRRFPASETNTTQSSSSSRHGHLNPLTLVPSSMSSKSYWNTYNRFKIVHMAACRELDYLQTWSLFMMLRRRWTGTNYEWERRGLPETVMEWKQFLPQKVFYHITGGVLEFDARHFWGRDVPIRRKLQYI